MFAIPLPNPALHPLLLLLLIPLLSTRLRVCGTGIPAVFSPLGTMRLLLYRVEGEFEYELLLTLTLQLSALCNPVLANELVDTAPAAKFTHGATA